MFHVYLNLKGGCWQPFLQEKRQQLYYTRKFSALISALILIEEKEMNFEDCSAA